MVKGRNLVSARGRGKVGRALRRRKLTQMRRTGKYRPYQRPGQGGARAKPDLTERRATCILPHHSRRTDISLPMSTAFSLLSIVISELLVLIIGQEPMPVGREVRMLDVEVQTADTSPLPTGRGFLFAIYAISSRFRLFLLHTLLSRLSDVSDLPTFLLSPKTDTGQRRPQLACSPQQALGVFYYPPLTLPFLPTSGDTLHETHRSTDRLGSHLQEGVNVVFGMPGGMNLPIYDALLAVPEHPPRPGPSRAGRRAHGRWLRPGHRRCRRVHRHLRPRRHQSGHRPGQRHDGFDPHGRRHRPGADHPAGQRRLPGDRCDRRHPAGHQAQLSGDRCE